MITILVNLSTGEEIEFRSAAQAAEWLGLNSSAVRNSIRDNYLLKNKQFKAYYK